MILGMFSMYLCPVYCIDSTCEKDGFFQENASVVTGNPRSRWNIRVVRFETHLMAHYMSGRILIQNQVNGFVRYFPNIFDGSRQFKGNRTFHPNSMPRCVSFETICRAGCSGRTPVTAADKLTCF